jgi:hypothetical protein
MDGEHLLKRDVGLLRLSGMRAAYGRIYLTNFRFIFSPFTPYSWVFGIKEPLIIPLPQLRQCTLGSTDFRAGHSILLSTDESSWQIHVYRSLIGAVRAERNDAEQWISAIENAARALESS